MVGRGGRGGRAGGAASDGLCSGATDGSAGVFGVGEGDVHVRAVLLGNLVLHVHQTGEFFFHDLLQVS